MEVSKIDEDSQLMISATVKFPYFSSVLIELVNNSLKALADYIEVQIDSSSNKLIVKDNGTGLDTLQLSKEFCQLSSTSLGLLRKIANVSVFSFKDQCFSVKNGKINESRALNRRGTVIFIENLYFNVPVRVVQFKKTLLFECFSGIEDLLIIQPEVCLKIVFDNEEIASFAQVSTIQERLSQISGCKNLKSVRFYGKAADIEGFLCDVDSCVLHKKYQFLMIDSVLKDQPDISNRINSIYLKVQKILSKEIKSKKFPVFFLDFSNKNTENSEFWLFECLNDLTLMLKEQIFPDSIFSQVFSKFLSHFSKKRGKPEWIENKSFTFTSSINDQELIKTLDSSIIANQSTKTFENSSTSKTSTKSLKNTSKLNFSFKTFDDSSIKSTIKELFPENLQNFTLKSPAKLIKAFNFQDKKLVTEEIEIHELLIHKIIGQIDNKFIAANIKAENSTIFTVFDQHASHERIRLEELLKSLKQGLSHEKCKIFVKLTTKDLARFDQRKAVCEEFRFSLNKEADNHFLTSLPVVFGTLLTLQDFFITIHTEGAIPKPVLDVLKFKACRSAVKFGDHLEDSQTVQILSDLGKCKVFNQCAHGRPTFYPLIRVPENCSRGRLDYTLLKFKS